MKKKGLTPPKILKKMAFCPWKPSRNDLWAVDGKEWRIFVSSNLVELADGAYRLRQKDQESYLSVSETYSVVNDGTEHCAYELLDKLYRRGEQIELYNFGNCARDFTYVDDIVEGLSRVVARPPKNFPPHKVYNLGNGRPVNLLEFVKILQEELIRAEVLPADYDFEAHKKFLPMQAGDVPITLADTREFEREFNFKPSTPLRTGLRVFAEWYKKFYG